MSLHLFPHQVLQWDQELDCFIQRILRLEGGVVSLVTCMTEGSCTSCKHLPTLASLSGISSSFGPPISSSSSSFFFFWFLSCFSFSAFFFSSSNWAFFCALRCLLRSFFSSLSVRFSIEKRKPVLGHNAVPTPALHVCYLVFPHTLQTQCAETASY